MVVGIRVDSENIRTGEKKHCNSSYFTMVAKDEAGNNSEVPGLILSTTAEKRRFIKALKRLQLRKSKTKDYTAANFELSKYLDDFKGQNVIFAE